MAASSSTNEVTVRRLSSLISSLWTKVKGLFKTEDSKGVEFIRGTWSAATATWTGVTKDSTLVDGKQILLFLPFAGASNVTLNLTLAGGTTTGAKNCYWSGTARLSTQCPQYAIIGMVYRSSHQIGSTTYSGWWVTDMNTTYSVTNQSEIDAGTSTSSRLITPKLLHDSLVKYTKELPLLVDYDFNTFCDSTQVNRIRINYGTTGKHAPFESGECLLFTVIDSSEGGGYQYALTSDYRLGCRMRYISMDGTPEDTWGTIPFAVGTDLKLDHDNYGMISVNTTGTIPSTAQHAFVEGEGTTATYNAAHAEGYGTTAGSYNAHAEGNGTTASGSSSHAEGTSTTATHDSSHAEGRSTKALGTQSHSEGYSTVTVSDSAHAEGSLTMAIGISSHAEGGASMALGKDAHAEGYTPNGYLTTELQGAASRGTSTLSVGGTIPSIRPLYAIVYDRAPRDNGTMFREVHFVSDVIGNTVYINDSLSQSYPSGTSVIITGRGAIGIASHSEGEGTLAGDADAHAEGYMTTVFNACGHAEGSGTLAGYCAHSEGLNTKAGGAYSHSEGHSVLACGEMAHAEGFGRYNLNVTPAETYRPNSGLPLKIADADSSWIDRYLFIPKLSSKTYRILDVLGTDVVLSPTPDFTILMGTPMLMCGDGISIGTASHSEGMYCNALVDAAHAEGVGTISASIGMHAAGQYNSTIGGHARVTGWGSGADNRVDIERLDTAGVLWTKGGFQSTLQNGYGFIASGTGTSQAYVGFRAQNTTTGKKVSLEVNSNGQTRGLWDNDAGWWSYLDNNNKAFFKGTADVATMVTDYAKPTQYINIGWDGDAVASPTHFAVYTTVSGSSCIRSIKDCTLANARAAILNTNQIMLPTASDTSEGYLGVQAKTSDSKVNKTYLDATSDKAGVYVNYKTGSFADWILYNDGTNTRLKGPSGIVIMRSDGKAGRCSCGRISLSSDGEKGMIITTTSTTVGSGLTCTQGDILIYVNSGSSAVTLSYTNANGASATHSLAAGSAKAFISTRSSGDRFAGF